MLKFRVGGVAPRARTLSYLYATMPLRIIMLLVCLVKQPGRLKGVQAIGWYLEEANMAQVSINIADHEQTPIHTVYEAVCNEAKVALF